jgi:hypothetical protein
VKRCSLAKVALVLFTKVVDYQAKYIGFSL